MSMTTQCPSCGTMFRVTPQQLQAQHGMVRCGRCATVFDGFKVLATLAAEAQSEPLPQLPTPLPALELQPMEIAPVAEIVVPEPLALEQAAVAPAGEVATVEVVPADQVALASTLEPASAAVATIAAAPIAEPREETIEAWVPPVPAKPPRRNLVWTVGSLVLLLGLAAQFVYLYRGDIAAAVPEARPFLARWCKSLQCTVALPQHPRLISIEASDMQAVDSTNSGLIILTATLRNQATTTLGYPALDVVLTNTREHTVARRIFLPAEYLADSKDWRAGIAPSAEITIRLNIDSGDLGAAGFRLDLMAAPAT